VITFGMISIACSSYFHRTAASLVVSYLLILPWRMAACCMWYWLSDMGQFRLLLTVTVVPGGGGNLHYPVCQHMRPAVASAGRGQRRQRSGRSGAGRREAVGW
jgi:hypothetical protein